MKVTLFLAFVAILGAVGLFNARSFDAPMGAKLVNGGWAKSFEAHYDEHFPAKQLGVNLWAAIDYIVFREGRPGVVLGRRGWLYTDEEFNVAEGYERHIQDNLALIETIRHRLASAGIPLVVTVVPAKARVYPEYLDGRAPTRAHADLYARLLHSLTNARIPTADLLAPLTSGKTREPTYFRADTHWTPWGAKLAAASTARVIRDAGLLTATRVQYVTKLESTREYRGDLFGFLPLDPYFSALLPPQEKIRLVKTAAVGDAPTHSSDLFSDDQLPDIALVGTSYSANASWNFAGYLAESLGEEVANFAKQGKGPFAPMLAYLSSEDFRRKRPRLVIWEIPERSLTTPFPSSGA